MDRDGKRKRRKEGLLGQEKQSKEKENFNERNVKGGMDRSTEEREDM